MHIIETEKFTKIAKPMPGEIRGLELQVRALKDRRQFLPKQIEVLQREHEQIPKQISALERQIEALRLQK